MLRVFIENEAGSATKHHHDEKNLVPLFTEEVSRPFPYPYGFVIGTTSGDGDNGGGEGNDDDDTYIAPRHAGKANAICADGHVVTLRPEDITHGRWTLEPGD